MNFIIDRFISWVEERVGQAARGIAEAIQDAADWLRDIAGRLSGREALDEIEEAAEEIQAAAERGEEELQRAAEEIEKEAEELHRMAEESREREEELRRRLEEIEEEIEDLILEAQEAAEEERDILRQQLEELEEERREIRRELGEEEIPEEGEEPGPIDDSGLRRIFGPVVGEEEGPRWLERWAAREGVSPQELLWAIDHHSFSPASSDFRGVFSLPEILDYVRRLPPYVIPLVILRFRGVGLWELWIEES